MRKNITFDAEDEDFFGQVGSFGVPKFDNEMHGGGKHTLRLNQ